MPARRSFSRSLAMAILLLAGIAGAKAQDIMRFEHLTVDDGLSQNEVTAVLQDSLGFLWFGTPDGLNRYDGYEFVVFQFDPTEVTSISDNRITALLETSDGTLWVGTSDGLNRFDPEMATFTSFGREPGNATKLGISRISALLEDMSGQIWIGHSDPDNPEIGGLSRLDPLSGQAEWFELSSGENAVPVHSLAETNDGVIWVGTADGLRRFDPASNAFTTIRHDPADPNSPAGNDIRELFVDSEGQLWLGYWGDGLDCFNPASGEVLRHRPGGTDFDLGSGFISSVAQSSDGFMWIGTVDPSGSSSSSLHRYDPKSQSFQRIRHDPESETTIGAGTVRAVLEDRSHVLWVATDLGGLSRYDQVTQFIPHYFPTDQPTGLASPIVTAFLEQDKENIWVGTAVGLELFDRISNRFRHYRHRPGTSASLSDDHVTALAEWTDETIWVGTEHGLNRFNTTTGRSRRYLQDFSSEVENLESRVTALYSDTARNQLWIGTAHGLERMDVPTDVITHFHSDTDNASTLSSDQIVSLYSSQEWPNQLWVGTENGLNSVDLNSGEVVTFEADARKPLALSHRYVTALSTLPADSNALWVGTLAGGLNRLDIETGEFRRFTRRNSGLPGNTIYGIQPDGQGYLWLATNGGLVCFDPSNPEDVRTYGVELGVQSRQFNVGASYKTPRGEIALGGNNGFNIFSPSGFRDSPYVPKVVLTGYSIDGRLQTSSPDAILLVDEINLAHDQNDVTFEFVGLQFSRPEQNRYRVRLDRNGGDSTEWRDVGTQRTATYANLPPGRYTFDVQGSNSDGVWSNESARMLMRITPPWWQTWWFRIFAVVAVVGIAIITYKRRIRLIAQRNHELEELVTERTEELEQQTSALESKNDELEATLGQLRTAQTQLVQSEKLASLGRMTAGVAHEIKNPLNFVNNFAQLSEELTEELRTELASSADRNVGDVMDEVDHILGDLALNASKIAEHGRRADGIVKSMLLHAQGSSGDPEPTNLHTLLDETIDLVIHGSGAGGDGMPINIKRDYDEGLGDVIIVRQAIGRVVLNLMENAVYAMRENPSRESDRVPAITVRTADLGKEIRIVVEDNGPGIPEEVRLRLFEPFFTTKPSGEGTGLGLSLAHDIVQSHRGQISAASTPGEGTSFTILLPKHRAPFEGAD